MNWFDLVILIFLLIALLNGYRKGLIMQLVGLSIIIISAIFGGKLAVIILPELNRLLDISPNITRVLSFVLSFAAISIVISFVGRLLQGFTKVVFLGFVNRLMGSLVAAGTLMFILSIILNLVLMLDIDESLIKKEIKEESFFFERVEAVVPAVVPYLNKKFWEKYVPENFREKIESKSDSILHVMPKVNNIDSIFQQKHFIVD